MDNFEDNSVENEQHHMIQAWAKYICQMNTNSADFTENCQDLIESIFSAQQRGDSCIEATASDAEKLQHLVMQPAQDSVAKPFVYDAPYLYLYRYWALEKNIAEQIARLKNQNIQQVHLNEQHLALLSDPFQKAALEMVMQQAFSIITGGPGTGKTYTLARIIAVLGQMLPDVRIAMAAPTGKAAQRMKEALMKSIADPALDEYNLQQQHLNPVTIHRLLGLGHRHIPRFHDKQPLPYDVIVVDEASMLDLNLAKMLLAAVPEGARLILLGDAQQLASVDVGSVLADLQQVDALKANRVHLQNSRRFQADAMIGQMAKFIQQNDREHAVLQRFEQQIVAASELQPIQLSGLQNDSIQLQYLIDRQHMSDRSSVYAGYYDQLSFGFSDFVEQLKQPIDDFKSWVAQVVECFDHYRILAAIRYGDLGLDKINEQIEARILQQTQQVKKGEWYIGRPVMMTYNDYQLGLSNGDIGLCFYQPEHAQFEVYFPSLEQWIPATRLPKNIQTAYALTIHKSQGSEFTHTAVVLDITAEDLLAKELIYTAITRAKKVVSLLVHPQAFTRSLSRETSRSSGLTQKINQIFSEK